MFTSIAWQTFFSALVLAILAYYTITSLLLYSSEIHLWFKGQLKPSANPPLKESHPIPVTEAVMGEVNHFDTRAGQRVSEVINEDIAINSKDETQEPIQPLRQGTAASADNLLIGSVADLLEEIKTLVQLIGEYKSDKTESQAFFHALFLRYPQLKGTTYQDAINIYLLEAARSQFSFDVSLQEIASWWITPKSLNK